MQLPCLVIVSNRCAEKIHTFTLYGVMSIVRGLAEFGQEWLHAICITSLPSPSDWIFVELCFSQVAIEGSLTTDLCLTGTENHPRQCPALRKSYGERSGWGEVVVRMLVSPCHSAEAVVRRYPPAIRPDIHFCFKQSVLIVSRWGPTVWLCCCTALAEPGHTLCSPYRKPAPPRMNCPQMVNEHGIRTAKKKIVCISRKAIFWRKSSPPACRSR